MDSILEAFKVYQREYLCKNESEIRAEMGKLLHCHELVVNQKR